MFNDNNGAVFLSQEAALNSRSKHIDIRHHYIRYLVKRDIIQAKQCELDVNSDSQGFTENLFGVDKWADPPIK